MIDTIHLKINVHITDDQLGPKWVKTTKIWNRGRSNERRMICYEITFFVGHALIVLKYFPCDYTGQSILVVEISSLPKVIHETNAIPLEDVQEAFDKLNRKIRSMPGIPEWFDVRVGQILRIDIYHDFSLGSNCIDYLDIISQLIYPYRDKKIFTNHNSPQITNGIFFATKRGSVLKFYDKGINSNVGAYFGVLRLESCVRGCDSLIRAFGSPSPILAQITDEQQTGVVINDLNILGLNNPINGDFNVVFDNLKNKYGISTAYRLRNTIEVLSKFKVFNISEVSIELGIKKSTLYRRLKQIKEAGIVPALIPGNKRLESLTSIYWLENFPKIQRNLAVIPGEK